MDDIFTRNFKFKEKVTDEALYSEENLTPSKSSLEFIKSFARNFRVYNAGTVTELTLSPYESKFSYGDILLSSKVLYHSENLFETFSVGSLLMYSPGYG